MKNLLARGGIEFLAVLFGISGSLWVDDYRVGLINKEKSINNQREFLSFQLDELNKFSFEKWDEQQINEEHEMLSNFENVQQLFKEISFYNNPYYKFVSIFTNINFWLGS